MDPAPIQRWTRYVDKWVSDAEVQAISGQLKARLEWEQMQGYVTAEANEGWTVAPNTEVSFQSIGDNVRSA